MDWQPLAAPAAALGESPFWHAEQRKLYWVDIVGRRINRCNENGQDLESMDLHAEPGCIAPVRGGGLVIAMRDGVYRLREWAGPVQRIAVLPYDPATTRANDGKCDALGRFWVGTVYEPRDARLAALYSLDARADAAPDIREQAGQALTGNGLTWSPDGKTLYWADTPSHCIYAWDFNVDAAVLSRQRVFMRFDPKPHGWLPGDAGYGGRPDGAVVDSEGHLWVAMYEGARVLRISPEGRVVQSYPTPVRCPTMPAFGGADGRTLFLTSASHGRSAQEIAQLPLSGKVLALRVDARGLAVNDFDPGA
nr:SMP-30/gluconolactonase/LRE family protein [Comamonas composti]